MPLSPEHDRLLDDLGTWRVEIVASGPQGEHHAAGTGTIRAIGGGRWVLTDFVTDGGDFEGHGVAGYDPDRGYVSTWVDTMRPFLSVMAGTWEDATQTMTWTGEGTIEGRPMRWRERSTREGPDVRVFRNHVVGPDGVEREVMVATWRRA